MILVITGVTVANTYLSMPKNPKQNDSVLQLLLQVRYMPSVLVNSPSSRWSCQQVRDGHMLFPGLAPQHCSWALAWHVFLSNNKPST